MDKREWREKMDIDKKKMAAIETVMNQIEKQYGKGSIVKFGSY